MLKHTATKTTHNIMHQISTTDMGEACSQMDLTAIHHILLSKQYKDDPGFSEPSFQEWTQEMKDIQDKRERGDHAFRDEDFEVAIDYYTQFVDGEVFRSATVFARRSLCHLMSHQPDAALLDAMQAQTLLPDWPTAFYMQSVALAKLNMQSDASDMLNEALHLELKRIQYSEEQQMKKQKTSLNDAPQPEEKRRSDGGETFSFPTTHLNS